MNDMTEESTTFDPSKFSIPEGKPLPVYLLLDVSGTMNEVIGDDYERTGEIFDDDGKTWERVKGGTTRLKILCEAVRLMLGAFAEEEQKDTRILVAIITFGAEVKVLFSPSKASEIDLPELKGGGETPLGKTLAEAKRMVEDKDITPSNVYRPTVVLVSDGKPNDAGWEDSLEQFIDEGRSSKCDRMAMAIGPDADVGVLGRFLEGTDHSLFEAGDASKISDFF